MSAKETNHPAGFILLPAVVISAALLLSAVILLKIVYNNFAGASAFIEREKAFWCSAAGIQQVRFELQANPGWFTDLGHYPDDDLHWLTRGAVGQIFPLGSGRFKIVKEQGKEQFYSLGFYGRSLVIIKKSGNSWAEL